MYVPLSAEEKHLLRRTARMWGVQPDYINSDKELVKIKSETLIKILESMSGRVIDSQAVLKELVLEPKKRKIERVLEPVYVVPEGKQVRLQAYIPVSENHHSWEFVIRFEDGTQTQEINRPFKGLKTLKWNDQKYLHGYFDIPATIPIGYHDVELRDKDQVLAKSLIMGKPKTKILMHKNTWGAFAPLYGLRGPRNWGIGDMRDMEEFQSILHKYGGTFFGTLPLLAAVNDGPGADPSPYSPVSRLFWNEIYLDVQSLTKNYPELWNLTQEQAFLDEVQRLQKLDQVDHIGVMALKKPILIKLAEAFFANKENGSEAYLDFLKRTPLVQRYAEFRSEGKKNLREYHLYVQFQMDQSFKNLHERAQRGETAGLYLDFPVGANREGFDSEFFASSFLPDVSAGAPPDMMFIRGQNWGFAPLHPQNIREQGYFYFIQCIRHHMRYATILRLDHVMAFLRIYTIPRGVDAKSGGYVRFHPEEFFALLTIEAERWGVEVVGEDLGTVPESMRALLSENKSLGMWVLPFEVGDKPKRGIAQAKTAALACMNTHDMIPFSGFLNSKDNILFESLGVLSSELAKEWGASRLKSVQSWYNDFGVETQEELLEKILEAMAASPSRLLLINIEDLWQEETPQNVPGTWKEYPNWQRKLQLHTREWAEDRRYVSLLKRISKLREQSNKR